jgi:hypothetical protein
MTRRRSSLVFACAAILIVANCWAPSAAPARDVNPCSLLTNAEAAKAIGGPIVRRTPSSVQKVEICDWGGKSLGGFEPTSRGVTLTMFRSTQLDFVRSFGAGDTRITDLGTPAWASRAFLSLYRHGYTLDISISLVTSPLRAEKQLAAAALKRL